MSLHHLRTFKAEEGDLHNAFGYADAFARCNALRDMLAEAEREEHRLGTSKGPEGFGPFVAHTIAYEVVLQNILLLTGMYAQAQAAKRTFPANIVAMAERRGYTS